MHNTFTRKEGEPLILSVAGKTLSVRLDQIESNNAEITVDTSHRMKIARKKFVGKSIGRVRC